LDVKFPTSNISTILAQLYTSTNKEKHCRTVVNLQAEAGGSEKIHNHHIFLMKHCSFFSFW